MAKQEGTPRGETLIFDTPEEGKQFAERAQEKWKR